MAAEPSPAIGSLAWVRERCAERGLACYREPNALFGQRFDLCNNRTGKGLPDLNLRNVQELSSRFDEAMHWRIVTDEELQDRYAGWAGLALEDVDWERRLLRFCDGHTAPIDPEGIEHPAAGAAGSERRREEDDGDEEPTEPLELVPHHRMTFWQMENGGFVVRFHTAEDFYYEAPLPPAASARVGSIQLTCHTLSRLVDDNGVSTTLCRIDYGGDSETIWGARFDTRTKVFTHVCELEPPPHAWFNEEIVHAVIQDSLLLTRDGLYVINWDAGRIERQAEHPKGYQGAPLWVAGDRYTLSGMHGLAWCRIGPDGEVSLDAIASGGRFPAVSAGGFSCIVNPPSEGDAPILLRGIVTPDAEPRLQVTTLRGLRGSIARVHDYPEDGNRFSVKSKACDRVYVLEPDRERPRLLRRVACLVAPRGTDIISLSCDRATVRLPDGYWPMKIRYWPMKIRYVRAHDLRPRAVRRAVGLEVAKLPLPAALCKHVADYAGLVRA